MKTREDGWQGLGVGSWHPGLQRSLSPRHTCGFPWARGVACTSLFLASLPSLCEVSMVVLGETRPSWEILISFHRLRGNLL